MVQRDFALMRKRTGRIAKPAIESTKPGPGVSIPAFRKPKGGLVAETC